MALNPEQINFFLNRIAKSDWRAFGTEAFKLFKHLDSEVKDNPIFEKYEKDQKQWENWLEKTEEDNGFWYVPSDLEDAKLLSYHLYKKIGNAKEEAYQIPNEIISKKGFYENILEFNSTFLDYFKKSLEDIIKANPEIENNEVDKVSGNTVFIIHGHDIQLRLELQQLLDRAGVRNIVLHEQPDKGRTIIDKLVEEGKASNYAIALLSPDDVIEGGEKRARQNVILEIGYFMGKLGKERIRLLVKDNIDIPSDLSGILYEKHDASGAWKMRILKELQAIGIFVDFNSVVSKF